MAQKLWTRDFTIITLGTVVSMLGNALSGFAIGLVVLDYTESVFLYALFMVAYNLPKLVMPLVAGPYLDNFSRKKAIYGLDFLSSAIYMGVFFLLQYGAFSYTFFFFLALAVGSIDSVYLVAYDSLYPNLISEGNYRKAYSISSMIYPLATLMIPVAAYLYEKIGLSYIFALNAATFFVAAVFETQIKAVEKHTERLSEKYGIKRFKADFKEGIDYIKAEKALLVITAYFSINSLAGAAQGTLTLPFFKATPSLGVMAYTFVMGCAVIGRLIGGTIHYKFKYPTGKKFMIALIVYIVYTLVDATYMFLPLWAMMVLCFMTGFMGVTSYNIRISATQSYIPDTHRARFNGAFQMLCNLGMIVGDLMAGALGDFLPPRGIIVGLMACNFVAIYFTMVKGKEYVKPLYNREV